ncbi:hypothetical protein FISHEDRAFT_73436 [Fistulina hepatica ATCC 64428]|uniref:Uncharacterized protein n=1 Tax=Fistulina hepatica ATCC 64428 TaxID=1128425 RepID=A0A0D7ACS4_9AGAR|nr:hypothetical protein FISHEDRAFT_73436 [Fistulina hepatica ATCC 64428]
MIILQDDDSTITEKDDHLALQTVPLLPLQPSPASSPVVCGDDLTALPEKRVPRRRRRSLLAVGFTLLLCALFASYSIIAPHAYRHPPILDDCPPGDYGSGGGPSPNGGPWRGFFHRLWWLISFGRPYQLGDDVGRCRVNTPAKYLHDKSLGHCQKFAIWSYESSSTPPPINGSQLGQPHADSRFQGTQYATTFFEISPSQSLLLLSRGLMSQGQIRIIDALSPATDTIRVNITARSQIRGIERLAQVCLMERSDGRPSSSELRPPEDRDHELDFEVLVTIPQSIADAQYNIEIDMPRFTQELSSNFSFDQVLLRSFNGHIKAQVSGDTVHIETTEGNTEGTFNVSSSLILHSGHASIKPTAYLRNDPAVGQATTFELHTSEAEIDASIHLLSSALDGAGGAFKVEVAAVDSPMTLDIVSAPLNANINITAQSSAYASMLSLPNTYEGEFLLTAPSPLVEDRHLEDPLRNGRPRVVATTRALDGSTPQRRVQRAFFDCDSATLIIPIA